LQSRLAAGVAAGGVAEHDDHETIMMRLDFVLAGPPIGWVASQPKLGLTGCLWLPVLAILGLCCWLRILDWTQSLEIYRSSAAEIAEKADMPGWYPRAKLGVLSMMLSPVGWICF